MYRESPLCIGIIFASFIASGKIPSLIDLLKIVDRVLSRAVLAILTNLEEMPNISVVLLEFSDLIIRLISCGVVSLRNREQLLGFLR